MPAKELTPTQKEDAARLKAAFERHQANLRQAGKPFNQAAILGEPAPFGQSALSQYLNGRIPLNWQSLQLICSLIGAKPAEISPSIVEQEREARTAWDAANNANVAREATPMFRNKPSAWPFPDIDQAQLMALRGTHAIAIQAAILGAAAGLGINLSGTEARKRSA